MSPPAAAKGPVVPKPNKPPNSNFRQQRLISWQPILSPPYVVSCLLVIAVAFIPIGIAVVYANKTVIDVEYRYDNINNCDFNRFPPSEMLFAYPNVTSPQFTMGCTTVVNFTLDVTLNSPVYLYYALTNFYQNHRRFAKSRSYDQLAGEAVSGSTISDCDPFATAGESNNMGNTVLNYNGVPQTYSSFTYSPCGLVPWSFFNDSFALYQVNSDASLSNTLICDGSLFSKSNNSNLTAQNCSKSGISWSSDSARYKTPALGDSFWTAKRTHYGAALPPTNDTFLLNGWYAGEAGHDVPVTTDEDLQVWMRTAALSSFRKLYRVINVDLPPGNYSMVIREFFPVASFNGEKSFALSTISWLGGSNQFLGIAYLTVGALSAVLALAFYAFYKINGDRTQQAIDALSELQ